MKASGSGSPLSSYHCEVFRKRSGENHFGGTSFRLWFPDFAVINRFFNPETAVLETPPAQSKQFSGPERAQDEQPEYEPVFPVRSRNGFMGTPDATSSPHSKSGKEELRNALLSPFQANGFSVHLSAFYSPSAHRSTVLRAMFAIEAHALAFKDGMDDKKQLNLEILAAAYGPNNRVVSSSDKTFGTEMTPGQMKDIVASGLVYGFDIGIPKPGPWQLRIAARDNNSEHLGSAHAFVDVPDFNRGELALSTLTLRDLDPQRNAQLARVACWARAAPSPARSQRARCSITTRTFSGNRRHRIGPCRCAYLKASLRFS